LLLVGTDHFRAGLWNYPLGPNWEIVVLNGMVRLIGE
jgi:hypothetical protein